MGSIPTPPTILRKIMNYIIKFTTTKPQGTKWYAKSGRSGALQTLADIAAWNQASAGYISQEIKHINDNLVEGTVTFNSKVNGDAWLLAAQSEPNHVIRDTYLKDIGVTQTITMTEQ